MERSKKVVIILIVAMLLASMLLNVFFCITTSRVEVTPVRDTLRVTYVDTVQFFKPVPRDSVILRYITVKLPQKDDSEIAGNLEEINAIPEIGTDSDFDNTSNSTDSVEVVVPITQRVYSNSSYTAYVSGYNPSLDSLILYQQREVLTVTERYKTQSRWGIGIQAGYGVSIKGGTPQFAPYIGVGITYNIFTFPQRKSK